MAPPVRLPYCAVPHEPHPEVHASVPAEPCPAPQPPTRIEVPVAKKHFVILFGDTQINVMPYQASAYRSLLVKNFVTSGLRLPLANTQIFGAMKVLFEQAIPPEERPFYRGSVGMGDVVDVASREELTSFFDLLNIMRENLILFLGGNHEIYPEGVDHYGIVGLALSWLLGLLGERNVREDLHGPEVNGVANILDKNGMVEMVLDRLFGRKPQPVVIVSADRDSYILEDGRRGSWHNTEQVVRDLWRQETNGTWVMDFRYRPGDRKRTPEQERVFASAVEIGKVPTKNGTFSLHLLGKDTYDSTTQPGNTGALDGHEGFFAEAGYYAFVQETTKRDPNALFLRLGHERPTGMATPQEVQLLGHYGRPLGLEPSIESRLLSHESVIASLGAHHHERGFNEDLCKGEHAIGGLNPAVKQRYCIGRKNPHPELTVPSVIDNGELVVLRFEADPNDPDQLVIEFEFVGIDESRIPGMIPEVHAEYEELKPLINTFYRTLPFITDPRFRREAEQGPKTGEKIYWATSIRRGFLWDPEDPDALIIANDTIPSLVEQKKTILRETLAEITVDLIQLGLDEEAADFKWAFLPILQRLDRYYADIVRAKAYAGDTGHEGAHGRLHMTDGLQGAADGVMTAMRAAMREEANPLYRKILEYDLHAVQNLVDMTNGHREWLVAYEGDIRAGRRPGEMRGKANLFFDPAFRIYWDHLRERPKGSAGAALGALCFGQSWREDFKYNNVTREGKMPDDFFRHDSPLRVPDRIRIVYDTKRRTERVIHRPLTDGEIRQKISWWDGISRPAAHASVTNAGSQLADSLLKFWQAEGETEYSLGFSLGRGETFRGALGANPFAPRGGNRGISLQAGRRLVLMDEWWFPHVNLTPSVGADFNWQARTIESLLGPELQETFSTELPVRARLTVGDPYGYLEGGFLYHGGLVYGPSDHGTKNWGNFHGWGIGLAALDGSIKVDAAHPNYSDRDDAWQVLLSFTDRFPDIFWNGIGHKSPKLPKLPVPQKK